MSKSSRSIERRQTELCVIVYTNPYTKSGVPLFVVSFFVASVFGDHVGRWYSSSSGSERRCRGRRRLLLGAWPGGPAPRRRLCLSGPLLVMTNHELLLRFPASSSSSSSCLLFRPRPPRPELAAVPGVATLGRRSYHRAPSWRRSRALSYRPPPRSTRGEEYGWRHRVARLRGYDDDCLLGWSPWGVCIGFCDP